MMVLRHIGPPSCSATVVRGEEAEDEASSPIDLSKKHVGSLSEVPRSVNKPPYRPDISSRFCGSGVGPDLVTWHRHDEENSYSSPDSGLHRDSLGEDEDFPHAARRRTFIPLSRIHARYSQRPEEAETKAESKDQVQTKRARLDCLIANIKQSKPIGRGERSSEERSSGEQVTSSDEVPPEGRGRSQSNLGAGSGGRDDEDEPCNLAFSKPRSHSLPEPSLFESWKKECPPKGGPPLSPSEAAKMYGIDPDTYQQQMMQFQLTSAAMMGEGGGLLKAMGSYPPWLYLGYYSQLLHSFQAQEILRQYAIQSQNMTPALSQGEKSPSVPRTLGSSGYNCRSPLSPASLSEGPTGLDSDGSVGQTTGGSGNGKRAPRAMTGRHVRTGTGASPSTLQTLRLKIEERQRLKAAQQRQVPPAQPQSKVKGTSKGLKGKARK